MSPVQTEFFRRVVVPLFIMIGLFAARPARASKWVGPQFVVVDVVVISTAPCPTENVVIEDREWIIDRRTDCVLYRAQPKKVREIVSSWKKDPAPYLKGVYHFAATKGALRPRQSALVLLEPKPRYAGKLSIVGQTIKTRLVTAKARLWHSELNVVNLQGEQLRLELRVEQRQLGRLAAPAQQGYSLLIEFKKGCVELGKSAQVELRRDCVSVADFRHTAGSRVFQTNRVRGAIDFASLSRESGFGPFVGRIDIIGEGDPERESTQGTKRARFIVHESGDIEELLR